MHRAIAGGGVTDHLDFFESRPSSPDKDGWSAPSLVRVATGNAIANSDRNNFSLHHCVPCSDLKKLYSYLLRHARIDPASHSDLRNAANNTLNSYLSFIGVAETEDIRQRLTNNGPTDGIESITTNTPQFSELRRDCIWQARNLFIGPKNLASN